MAITQNIIPVGLNPVNQVNIHENFSAPFNTAGSKINFANAVAGGGASIGTTLSQPNSHNGVLQMITSNVSASSNAKIVGNNTVGIYDLKAQAIQVGFIINSPQAFPAGPYPVANASSFFVGVFRDTGFTTTGLTGFYLQANPGNAQIFSIGIRNNASANTVLIGNTIITTGAWHYVNFSWIPNPITSQYTLSVYVSAPNSLSTMTMVYNTTHAFGAAYTPPIGAVNQFYGAGALVSSIAAGTQRSMLIDDIFWSTQYITSSIA